MLSQQHNTSSRGSVHVITPSRAHVLFSYHSIMEQFIERVKHTPWLWDMNHIHYRDITKKESAWKSIAKDCDIANGKEAKTQWKKLRDSHREAMRRRKIPSSLTGFIYKPWKYEEQMEFLLPPGESRANWTNFLNDPQSVTHDIDDTESPSSAPESSHLTSRPTEPEKRKQMKLNTDTAISQQRREKVQPERDELRRKAVDTDRYPKDALSNLFTSFCQKTRELPKYLQLRVQREIFESVTRAEEEALSLETMNAPSSPTSSSASSYNQNSLAASPGGQTSPTSSPTPDAAPQNQSYLYTVVKQEEDS